MNPDVDRIRRSIGTGLTPVVRTLLWINGAVYMMFLLVGKTGSFSYSGTAAFDLQLPFADTFVRLFGLVPYSVIHERAYWQPVTYLFLHRDFFHLLMNMLALWWFGADVERRLGSRRFLQYYAFTGIGAGLASMAFHWSSHVPTIGASGAVFGLLLAFGMLFPERTILLYFFLPLKAKYCVALFGLLEVAALWSSGNDGVNHLAHVSGFVFGLLWFGYARSGVNFRQWFKMLQRRRLRRKLRLIRRGSDDDPPTPLEPYSSRTLH